MASSCPSQVRSLRPLHLHRAPPFCAPVLLSPPSPSAGRIAPLLPGIHPRLQRRPALGGGTSWPSCAAGYIIALEDIPNPMWRYPMHYIGYHTYGIHGMMLNEFEDTDGWDCPCTLQPEGCPEEDCTINGVAVRTSPSLRAAATAACVPMDRPLPPTACLAWFCGSML